jgi:hypothetical protein
MQHLPLSLRGFSVASHFMDLLSGFFLCNLEITDFAFGLSLSGLALFGLAFMVLCSWS